MMYTIKDDLTDRVFNRWTVLHLDSVTKHFHKFWRCRCECGREKVVESSTLTNGRSKSCGCLRREIMRARATHKDSGSVEHHAWSHIVQRCTNPKDESWHNYGARGISICVEWRNSFAAFLAHVGRRPSPQHTIDRINNDGNYEPGNMRWATRQEQSANRRGNHYFTYQGRTQCITNWANEFGINRETLRHRLVNRKLPFELAILIRPNCAHCGFVLRKFITGCPHCKRDCHEGCWTQHMAECGWHHSGFCNSECRFCLAAVTRREAVGGLKQ